VIAEIKDGGKSMDRQGMELNELIDKARAELRKIGYSDSYIRWVSTVWNRLTDYIGHNGKTFTAKVGMDFLEAEYGIIVFRNLDSKKKALCQGNQPTRRLSVAWDYIPQNQAGNPYFPPAV
jgi:hypothetical protein